MENRYKVNAKNTAEKQVRFDKAHLALSKKWASPSDAGCTPIIPTTYDVGKRMKMTKSGVLIMILHIHGFESDFFVILS